MAKSATNDIGELLDQLAGTDSSEAEPVEPTAEPATEPPVVEPVVEEPPAAEPADEPAETETEKALRKQIEELSMRLVELQASKSTDAVANPEPSPAVFVTQEDFETGIFDTPDKLNKVLSTVEAKARENTMRQALPIIEKMVTRRMEEFVRVQQFWVENSDLTEYKGTVAMLANEVHTAHPEYDADRIFKEAANETRKQIEEFRKRARKSTPAVPRTPSTAPAPAVPTTGVKSELDAMMRGMGLL